MARLAHETLSVVNIRGWRFQSFRFFEEKASNDVCWSNGIDVVGYIQYSSPNFTASGSAYHPGNTGLPLLLSAAANAATWQAHNASASAIDLRFMFMLFLLVVLGCSYPAKILLFGMPVSIFASGDFVEKYLSLCASNTAP